MRAPATSTRSPRRKPRSAWPNSSSPRPPAHALRWPSRASATATLTSAPPKWRTKPPTERSGPTLSGSRTISPSPSVTPSGSRSSGTSGGRQDGLDDFTLLERPERLLPALEGIGGDERLDVDAAAAQERQRGIPARIRGRERERDVERAEQRLVPRELDRVRPGHAERAQAAAAAQHPDAVGDRRAGAARVDDEVRASAVRGGQGGLDDVALAAVPHLEAHLLGDVEARPARAPTDHDAPPRS